MASALYQLDFRVVDLVKDPESAGSLTRATTSNPNSQLQRSTRRESINYFLIAAFQMRRSGTLKVWFWALARRVLLLKSLPFKEINVWHSKIRK